VIQNDSARRQRQWADLTDLKKLTHIQRLVDESIQVHTGKVSSIEEFAEKTTQYSQERSQYPITVEAVKVEGRLCLATEQKTTLRLKPLHSRSFKHRF
jgi:hypothetical protein